MKIKCKKCGEIFDLPENRKIDIAVCPFCECKNSTKPTKAQTPKPKGYAEPLESIRPKPRHPLSMPLALIATCLLILTGITVLFVISLIAGAAKQAEEQAEFDKQMTETIEKADKEFQKTTEAITKTANNLLAPFGPKPIKQP